MNELVDLDAERAVVGAVLTIPDTIADLADWLPPDAFGNGQCRSVYRAMCALWSERIPSDDVTILNQLRKRKSNANQDAVIDFLRVLRTEYYPGVYATYHGRIILELARRRAGVDAAAALVKAAHEAEPDWDEALVGIRRAVEAYQPVSTSAPSLAEQVDAFRDLTLRRWDGEHVETVVTTGIPAFDRMVSGGMRAEELIVIGARPSMGKTALMLHMARQANALVFSLEMPERQILNRLISSEAGVSFETAMTTLGDIAARNRWLEASERVASWPLTIVDTPGMTTARIEAMVERTQQDRPVDAVYVDHLGYLADQFRHGNEQEKTGELIRRCKLGARRTGVPWVVLTQLNREVESRPSCMPYMSDIRSSGRVEEDADVVGLLFRRQYYVDKGMVESKPNDDWITATDWQRVLLNIAKNRNGAVGGVELGWEAKAMRYHDAHERMAA